MQISSLFLLAVSVAALAAACPAQAIAEHEYNDNAAYANDLGAFSSKKTVTGLLNERTDIDCFRFEAAADSVLRITTTYNGSRPDVLITNAFGDENWGKYRFAADRVVLPIPKGVYHVQIGGAIVLTRYYMSLELQSKVMPTLNLGQVNKVTVGPDYVGYRIVLPGDGRLSLNFTTSNQADAYLVLQNSQWGYIYEVDDARPATNDPGLDAVLPKGTYYLYVSADIPATTSISSTFTSLTIDVLNPSSNGTIRYNGASFELHRFRLNAVEEARLAIATRGTSGITDSYLQLFDRNMVQILESDDASSSTLSAIAVTLPPGDYYVASTGYHDNGDYLISKNSGTKILNLAQAGTNLLNGTTDRANTLQFKLETPSRVEFNIVGRPGYDAQVSVLDAKTGLSFGWEDDGALGPKDSNLGMRLPEGEYFIIAKNYDGLAGTFDAQIIPPLQRWESDHVRVRAHQDQLAYFLISLKLGPPSNPLKGLVSGNLLLDLSSILFFSAFIPWDGLIDFRSPLRPKSGIYMQMVTLDLVGPKGDYSNVLK